MAEQGTQSAPGSDELLKRGLAADAVAGLAGGVGAGIGSGIVTQAGSLVDKLKSKPSREPKKP